MTNLIRQIKRALHLPPEQPTTQRCNYANNYYGDQVCIQLLSDPNADGD
ncbi:hypothetical protein [Alteromonas flava]|nr:hypothetical protein [Alteromonas flava]